jgi:hypothetical protein
MGMQESMIVQFDGKTCRSKKFHGRSSPRMAAVLVAAVAGAFGGVRSVRAQTVYTYVGANNGVWSTPANWNPSTGYPGTGGVAGNTDVTDINNVTATQNVNYDTGASGFLGTLNITQTSNFTNEVTLQRSLTLTNPLTLSASGTGKAELATGTNALTLDGNLTVSAGGVIADSSSSGASLKLLGLTNSVNGGSGTNLYNVTFNPAGSSASTFTSNTSLTGTTILVPNGSPVNIASTGASLSINNFQFAPNTNNKLAELQLGSNLTVTSFSYGSTSESFTQSEFDANGYTLNLPATFAPGNGSASTAATFLLADSANNGQGIITSPNFNFVGVTLHSGSSGGVRVQNDVTLNATGSSGAQLANSLTSNAEGSVSATSTFEYSGSATSSAPATLASTPTIGNLLVKNGVLELSGAINFGASTGITVAAGGVLEQQSGTSGYIGTGSPTLNISGGGALDLETTAATVGAVTLGAASSSGSTIQSTGGPATLTTSGVTVNGTNNIVGTGVTLTGATTVTSSSALGGYGTLSGNTSVAGTIMAGTATAVGKLSIGGTGDALDLSSGGTYNWKLTNLADNTGGTPGTDFDQIVMTGAGNTVTLAGSSLLTLTFIGNAAGANSPNGSNPFWTTNHAWTIIADGVPNSNTTLFSNITDNSFADGSFSTMLDGSGDVLLDYTAATPEPASLGLLSFAGMAVLRRRRREISNLG